MSWVMVGVTGLSALASQQAAQRKNKQLEDQNRAAAEQTRYSAWSGLGPGQIDTGFADPTMSAVQGGLAGAATAQGIKGKPTPETTVESMNAGSMTAGNQLGGQQLSNQLGQRYSAWDFQDPNQMNSLKPSKYFAGN